MLQVFQFESIEVRFIGTAQKPEWVAADVCQCLALSDTSKALESLEDGEKDTKIVRTLGGDQEMLTVTEPGLYSLIFKSRKPAAKRFKRWVFHEVLPSIRKNGNYKAQSQAQVNPTALLAELNIAEQLLSEMGIDATIAKQLKFDNAIAYLPSAKQMLEAGKKLIAATDPMESVGMNATL